MFEVLMFLFENYMTNNAVLCVDSQTIMLELQRIGFHRYEIDRALDWIEGLHECQDRVATGNMSPDASRYYLPEETEILGKEGIGLLYQLEKAGILDSVTREIVIDRVMALDRWEVGLGRIRWVVLMALFNQPEKKNALFLLQEMILADAIGVLH